MHVVVIRLRLPVDKFVSSVLCCCFDILIHSMAYEWFVAIQEFTFWNIRADKVSLPAQYIKWVHYNDPPPLQCFLHLSLEGKTLWLNNVHIFSCFLLCHRKNQCALTQLLTSICNHCATFIWSQRFPHPIPFLIAPIDGAYVWTIFVRNLSI